MKLQHHFHFHCFVGWSWGTWGSRSCWSARGSCKLTMSYLLSVTCLHVVRVRACDLLTRCPCTVVRLACTLSVYGRATCLHVVRVRSCDLLCMHIHTPHNMHTHHTPHTHSHTSSYHIHTSSHHIHTPHTPCTHTHHTTHHTHPPHSQGAKGQKGETGRQGNAGLNVRNASRCK